MTPYATEYDSWGDYAYVLGVDSWADTTHVGVTVFAERRNAGASNVTFTDRGFKAGDAVTLSGCVTHKENDRSILVKEVTGTRLVFDSPVFQEGAEAGTVTVRRIVPDLDFICESGNRLWGVSNKDKTIYASALGDPTNFYIYDGVTVGNSMLSYAVPVGTDGDFTAICAYGSNVLCWKEQCLHKVLGTMPRQTTRCSPTRSRGCRRGARRAWRSSTRCCTTRAGRGSTPTRAAPPSSSPPSWACRRRS